jgi:hypothetical protein
MDEKEWHKLWSAVKEISADYPDGVAFIGGIAVYLHASTSDSPAGFAEFSHDGDFYFSLSDFADLRDEYEVTSNRRLSKHQIIKDGFEFDVYVERQNDLAIPYSALLASSVVIEGIRAACLEHLLVLKLDAAISRKGSSKGEKDQRDIVRVLWLLGHRKGGPDLELCSPYMTDARIAAMESAVNGPARLGLAGGNAFQAKQIAKIADKALLQIQSAHGQDGPQP